MHILFNDLFIQLYLLIYLRKLFICLNALLNYLFTLINYCLTEMDFFIICLFSYIYQYICLSSIVILVLSYATKYVHCGMAQAKLARITSCLRCEIAIN